MKTMITLTHIRMMGALSALRNDKRGVTILEYSMIAALVAVALAATLTTFKGNIGNVFTAIGTGI